MNIEKLKQVIIKANPEITKLTFGCEIEVAGHKALVISSMFEPSLLVKLGGDAIKIDEKYKILGRPIRLADVLLAMRKKVYDKSGHYRDPKWEQDIIKIWNLKDDNIDNQSDETKKFLEDLLIKKG